MSLNNICGRELLPIFTFGQGVVQDEYRAVQVVNFILRQTRRVNLELAITRIINIMGNKLLLNFPSNLF